MKIRSGFVSNSSSSSFIVYGFSTDNSCKIYDILKEKLKEEDPYISDVDVYWKIYFYLREYGIDYFHHEESNDTKEIGCVLEEVDGEGFNESMKKAEDTLKKFDEDHHTDFTKDYKIYRVFEDY